MLKNKKFLYFGIPFNFLLWGYIGYKIYKAFTEDDDSVPTEQNVSVSKLKKEDSLVYQLALNYSDPFLKDGPKIKPVRNSNKDNSNPPRVNVVPQKTVAALPKTVDLKYLGLVENKSSGVSTALISLNGRSYIVKKGETVDGVLIKSISSEKLEAKVGKETISVQK